MTPSTACGCTPTRGRHLCSPLSCQWTRSRPCHLPPQPLHPLPSKELGQLASRPRSFNVSRPPHHLLKPRVQLGPTPESDFQRSPEAWALWCREETHERHALEKE